MKAVFMQDLGALLRRPLVLILITMMLVGLTTLVTAYWPISDALTPDEISQRGRTVWQGSILIELAFIMLLAPAVAAPALSSERQGGTFILVMLSGIHPLSLAISKLGARFAVVSLVLLLPFPILITVATLGGTDFYTSVQVMVTLLALGLLATSLGIFFSALFDQAHRSVMASYCVLMLPFALPLILPAMGLTSNALVTGRFGLWEAVVSPYSNLEYISNPTAFRSNEVYAQYFWIQPLLWLTVSGLLLLATWPLIRRSLTQHKGQSIDERGSLARILDRLLNIGQWRQRLSQNPIYWRETSLNGLLRFRNSHRFNFYLTLTTFAIIVLEQFPTSAQVLRDIVAFLPGASKPDIKVHGAVIAGLMGLGTLATTVTATVSIGTERQSGLMQQLAVTPLRFKTFFVGKALGIGQNLIVLLMLPLIYGSIMVFQGEISILAIPLLLVAIPLTAFFAIVQGIFCALASRSQTRAITMALFLLGAQAFLPICCLFSFNPVFLGYQIVAYTDPTVLGGDQVVFVGLTFFSFGAHVFALFTISRWLRVSFDRFLGRVGTMELQLESAE
jgi:ABC-type transport system involved in multi-copper enzyme maturation permease subunit